MLDAPLRPFIDLLIEPLARYISRTGITSDQVTIVGFCIGITTIPLIALEYYGLAVICIALNRLLDGLDGAIARLTRVTDRGAFLDIVLDFIFYSAVIFGFGLAQPEAAVYSAFLIFSFVGSGSSFLAYAIFAERRSITTSIRGHKSLYYLGGLTEGTETFAVLVLMCLFPDYFPLIALIFGILCWVTTATRIAVGYRDFG